MKSIIVTTATAALLDRFYAAAMADRDYRRFYTQGGMLDWSPQGTTGWEKLTLVNATADAVACIRFDRTDGTVSLGVAALGRGVARGVRAGRLLPDVAEIILESPARRVFSSCAVTNVPSLRLHNRLFGNEYGIQPETAWDGRLGRWVDRAMFSASREAIAELAKSHI